MLSCPNYGWCKFSLGNFSGNPSYVTNVPVDTLKAFVDLFTKGCGIVNYDEEGTGFVLILTKYVIYIIDEHDNSELHEFRDINIYDLANEVVKDIKKNRKAWNVFFYNTDGEKGIKENEKEIDRLISELEKFGGKNASK